ncbi:MAG: FkbM family methyltransferase [Proteobacteria bacterium]|nr:FkbM family methyltransferase [Desulfobacula sp.]MBU3952580.1 FkbM family methyltransferase [Pseudomonadota bacterium]
MRIKKRIKTFIEHLTGTRIFRRLPRGISVFNDIKGALPDYHMDTIFDVGANVGKSAASYTALFPASRIFCFEPVAETYHYLRRNMEGKEQVCCFQLAMGAFSGKGTILLNSNLTMSCLVDEETVSLNNENIRTEQVKILTIEEFCKVREIGHIGYLKIDVEGRDLDVLKGAEKMLIEQNIDFVEVEAGMNPQNERHVPFGTLKAYLERHNYLIFGIYEQFNEWPTKEPHLRRVNAVFISQKMIGLHKCK